MRVAAGCCICRGLLEGRALLGVLYRRCFCAVRKGLLRRAWLDMAGWRIVVGVRMFVLGWYGFAKKKRTLGEWPER